nr:ribonuclease H-like domain-containing protein [Tanacetum cinerariifolium]
MSYLTYYEEIDRGYVAFGGNPKGGKITEKGIKDETNGILTSFIKRIENIVDQKVKVIRCDHRTEFKNREMNQFCKMKGILRQYSVARTPQKNRVAERRNMTLIEAVRTMLADSKLPTTFWAEALILLAMYKDNAGQARKETKHVKDYILLPLWTADPPFFQDSKSSQDDGFKPSSDDGKKVDEDPRKGSKCNDQEKKDNVNSTNNVNATGTNGVNAIGELPFDLDMPALEDVVTFDFSNKDEDDDEEADIKNLDTTIQGLQVKQKNDRIFISQDKYVGEILKKFRFTEVMNASTPMETQKPLLKDEDGEEVDVHMYRSMIGSLMYLTSSRPDIMFA